MNWAEEELKTLDLGDARLVSRQNSSLGSNATACGGAL
ncbi:MAG: transposase DNA-binding-containing protein [Leptothrix sp. (in: b-proteobacteria)]